MTMPEFKELVTQIKKEVMEIGPEELDEVKGEGAAIIDVREREDCANGSIPDAVNIPRGVLELNIDQVTTDKERPIVLFCGGGSRSALAAFMLQKMGFRNVYSLAGGYKGWKEFAGK